MAIIEVHGGPITHRYLMSKAKDELASLYMRLLRDTERDARDAERYRWLRDNAGAWEVSRDVGEWTRTETGEKFKPRVYFTAYSTSYGGLTIDEAIDAVMKGANA